MAWNGSNGITTKPEVKNAPSCVRGLIAGIAVILLLSSLMYFITPVKSNHHSSNIEPNAVGQTIVTEVSSEVSDNHYDANPGSRTEHKAMPTRVGQFLNGFVLLPSGDLHRVNGVITNGVEATNIVDKNFSCFSDRMLGHLLLVEPGEGMLGSSEELYQDFDDEFRKSLETEIVVSEDDSEEVRELKTAVIELRNELKQRMNAGENLAAIMADTRNQLLELYTYRDDLENQVLKITATTELEQKDYDDLLSAANEMLENKGIKPLELPATLKHAIRLQSLTRESNDEDVYE